MRLRIFVLLAAALAYVFVRLGLWQLRRLSERKASNAYIAARLRAPVTPFTSLPFDTGEAHYRRVRVSGRPDYAHEMLLAARTYKGSPGADLITPVVLTGHQVAVLVDRGWVYSPDGATVDLAKWRESDTTFDGYVEVLPPTGGGTYRDRPQVLTRLTAAAVSRDVPYIVAPVYVIALADSAHPTASDKPARRGLPALDEGPHLSYAIQWFAFALVALIGAGVVLYQRRGPPPATSVHIPGSNKRT